jgi:hypothetical protein
MSIIKQLKEVVDKLLIFLTSINRVELHCDLFKLQLEDDSFIKLNCCSIIDSKLTCSINDDLDGYYDIVIENDNINITLINYEWDDEDDIPIHLKTPIVVDNIWLVEPS